MNCLAAGSNPPRSVLRTGQLASCCLLAFIAACGKSDLPAVSHNPEIDKSDGSQELEVRFAALDVEGPSSVAYHAQRGTLLIASDTGYVAELDTDLKELDRYKVTGDLEGIAINPVSGCVLIASEREGAILEFDLSQQRVIRTLVVDYESHPELEDESKDNSGIEGIAFFPDSSGQRLFAVMQSDPARLLELIEVPGGQLTKKMRRRVDDRLDGPRKRRGEVGVAHIKDVIQLNIKPLSDVVFCPRRRALAVVSSDLQQSLLYRPDTAEIMGRFSLPGSKPEGLTFLPDGRLFVVDDEGGGWWIRDGDQWIEDRRL